MIAKCDSRISSRRRELAQRELWFRDVDSNHDTQLQRLMSYRLDDPGTGPISVADARKRAQAPPRRRISDPYFRAPSRQPRIVITFPIRTAQSRFQAARRETFSIVCT